MQAHNLATESRSVGGFDRVTMNDYGELIIKQGEREALAIDASPDMLPKLTSEVRDGTLILGIGGGWWNKLDLSTSLNRRIIRYRLTCCNLTGLHIHGAASVRGSQIKTDYLKIQLDGAGGVNIDSLVSQSVDIELAGTGEIAIAGQATEQNVRLSGMGNYSAGKLKSKTANVHLTGAGQATIWVSGNLMVAISGVGSVSYYGNPEVRQRIPGIGRLVSLGNLVG